MGDLGKITVAKGFEKLPKVQWIAQSGHTVHMFKLFPTHCCLEEDFGIRLILKLKFDKVGFHNIFTSPISSLNAFWSFTD